MMHRTIAVTTFALVLAGTSAQAQSVNMCIDQCFNTFSPSQNNGSTELRDECLQRCKPSNASRTQYGAIAFSPRTGAWGAAYGKGSPRAANASAMAECRANGEGCEPAISYANACGAVAAVKAKGVYTTGQGATNGEAKANAMRLCQSKFGSQCVLWVHSCSADRN